MNVENEELLKVIVSNEEHKAISYIRQLTEMRNAGYKDSLDVLEQINRIIVQLDRRIDSILGDE